MIYSFFSGGIPGTSRWRLYSRKVILLKKNPDQNDASDRAVFQCGMYEK
jgi:hypothetical protein